MECIFCNKNIKLINPKDENLFCSEKCYSDYCIDAKLTLLDQDIFRVNDKILIKSLTDYTSKVVLNIENNLKVIEKHAHSHDELYVIINNFGYYFLKLKEKLLSQTPIDNISELEHCIFSYIDILRLIKTTINDNSLKENIKDQRSKIKKRCFLMGRLSESNESTKKDKIILLDNIDFVPDLINCIFIFSTSEMFQKFYPTNIMNNVKSDNIEFCNINIFSKKIIQPINDQFMKSYNNNSIYKYTEFCNIVINNIKLIIQYCINDITNMIEYNRNFLMGEDPSKNRLTTKNGKVNIRLSSYLEKMILLYNNFVNFISHHISLIDKIKNIINDNQISPLLKTLDYSLSIVINKLENKFYVTPTDKIPLIDVHAYIFDFSLILERIILNINNLKTINMNWINLLLIDTYNISNVKIGGQNPPIAKTKNLFTNAEKLELVYEKIITDIIKP